MSHVHNLNTEIECYYQATIASGESSNLQSQAYMMYCVYNVNL